MNKLVVLFFLLGTSLFFSCESADSAPTALVNLVLVDTPAKWDSVLVEIEGVEVEILVQGRETESQRFFLEYKNGDKQIRVSDLIGGRGLIIGRDELPSGKIIGLSVQMGQNHLLYQEKKAYAMPLANMTDPNISLEVDLELEAGIAYDLVLDLDLEKSIIQKSASPLQLQLDPYFSVVDGVTAGEVSGTVTPLTLKPAIYLIQGTDSISTHPNTSGIYIFRVSPGIYSIYFDPKDSRYSSTTLTNVPVETGKTTEIPLYTFKLKP